jgi:hypothetical protein
MVPTRMSSASRTPQGTRGLMGAGVKLSGMDHRL